MAGSKVPKQKNGDDIPPDKLGCARKLAASHVKVEGTISAVAYITSAAEHRKDEPIKLLEINSATSASGFFPVAFGPSKDVPYSSTLVELTPAEARKLERRQLEGWPADWRVGKWLYRRRRGRPRSKG